MDYYNWSLEYEDTANEIANVIEKLKSDKKGKTETQRKEIDLKIAAYRTYYNECKLIANHLMARHEGVG